jgi:hypothetical protein
LRNDVPDERLFEAFSNLGHLTGMLNMKRLWQYSTRTYF